MWLLSMGTPIFTAAQIRGVQPSCVLIKRIVCGDCQCHRASGFCRMGSVLARIDAWIWTGPDERRLWSSAWGSGRTSAAALLLWRGLVGLSFLAFQAWNFWRDSNPSYYLAYLTHETMWLNFSYFLLAAGTGTAALVASYKDRPYAPGVPPDAAGSKLSSVSKLHRLLWLNTLRAQQMLFSIMCV
jgi:hypothetical protein